MSTRRGYHKVRGGCLTCKQRKVRCSLERPICYNCSRLSRSCSYVEKPSLQGTSSNASSPSESSGSQPNHALEIELMHQYTAFTCLLLSNDPVLIRLWRDVVPRIALKHPFLLHGIFAVAAQHKLHEMSRPTAELVEAATYYHLEALATYIHLLNNITEENCHALFVFSQLIVGLSYSHLILESGSGQALIVGMIEIFELLKGALAIAEKASLWLNAGELEPMMGEFPGATHLRIPETENPCTGALADLAEHVGNEAARTNTMGPREDALDSTIKMLHGLLLSPNDSVDSLNRTIGLPVWLDADFARLLRLGDQAALTLLAFYGVALDRIQDVWFFRGVGVALVRAVSATLDREWAPHVAWPLLEIEKREDYEGAMMSNHVKAE